MWKRLRDSRPTSLDALFAVSVTAMIAGLVAAILGILLSESGALPGIGIVGVVVGGYLTTVLRPTGVSKQDRSAVRSIGRGYRHLWHWARPSRSPRSGVS